ncbi:MAG: hypothetical protein BMS9Abin32_270 [Gammaproteobacteria bacterium]|nr:MAG: hypothetical protein BMS9Abin32_270 [Gammaproteobacteria bacterium]
MYRYWTLILIATLLAPQAFAADATPKAVAAVDLDALRRDPGVLPAGVIVGSGQPDAQALQRFADAGFVAVIDLRGDDEDRGLDEPREVERLGMQYISLPIASRDDISYPNAAALDRLLAGIDGPVLLHCGSGNRVGALTALRASLYGASDDEALAAGKAAGLTSLQPVVEKRLGREVEPAPKK